MITRRFNVVTDGGWGSCGKGAIATYLAWRHRPGIISSTNMANAGHCQVADTYVITDRGLERLGPTVLGRTATTTVNMTGEYAPVSDHYYDGVRTINRIVLHNGVRLGCTDQHRYWVWDTETTTAGWVRSMDLDPDRHVFLFPRKVEFCDRPLLPAEFRLAPAPNRTINLPPANHQSPDARFAQYLGLLVGDGCYAGTKKVSVAFHEDQLDVADQLLRLYADMGITNCDYRKVPDKRCWTVTTRQTSGLFELFRLIGLGRATKQHKTTPVGVMRSSKPVVGAYLSGLFDADGSVKRDRVQLSNCSRSVVEDAQQLLYILGVHSCLGVRRDRRRTKHGSRLPQYTLSVSGRRDLEQFSHAVGFLSRAKHERLHRLIARTEDQGTVVCISDATRTKLQRVGLARRGKTRTTAAMRKLSGHPDPELAALASTCGDYHLVAIKSVERAAGAAEVFDLTVPGTHSYIANGCISHNTGVHPDGRAFVAKALPSPSILGVWYPDYRPRVVLGPTAAFHLDRLLAEARECGLLDLAPEIGHVALARRLFIHPRAGVITQAHRDAEASLETGTKHIASTMQGCGALLADKVLRRRDLRLARDYRELDAYTAEERDGADKPLPQPVWLQHLLEMGTTALHEGSQGFSLDINHGSNYPECTSRSTTAVQNLADMGLPAGLMGDVYLVIRPYPIRVGNVVENGQTVGHSGGHYEDHVEISWEQVAREAGMPQEEAQALTSREYTTVTKRLRRVFSFSPRQLRLAAQINGATRIALNFASYIDWNVAGVNTPDQLTPKVHDFIHRVEDIAGVPVTLVGTGPRIDQMVDFEG